MIVKLIVKCVVMRMGSGRDGDPLPMIDLDVPEFYITDIRIEPAGGDCIRIYGCVQRRGHLVPRYSVVIPLDKSSVMARQTFEAAADYHNMIQLLTFNEDGSGTSH